MDDSTGYPGRLSPEDLAALGEVALSSAGLASIIELFVWKLLGVEEPAGTAITSGQSASRLADRLIQLAKRTELDPGLRAEIIGFAGAAKTVLKARNDHLHNIWVKLDAGTFRFQSVVVDEPTGATIDWLVAEAGPGQLPLVAKAMREFVRQSTQLLGRLDLNRT